jgi:hypothetical protein
VNERTEFERFTAEYSQSNDAYAAGQQVCGLLCSTRIYMYKIYTSQVHFAKLVVFKQHSYFVSDFIFFINMLQTYVQEKLHICHV